jgi:hypothetical protein
MNDKFNFWQERVLGMIEKTFDCTRSDAQAIVMTKTKDNPNWLLEKFMIGTSVLGVLTELIEVN